MLLMLLLLIISIIKLQESEVVVELFGGRFLFSLVKYVESKIDFIDQKKDED